MIKLVINHYHFANFGNILDENELEHHKLHNGTVLTLKKSNTRFDEQKGYNLSMITKFAG